MTTWKQYYQNRLISFQQAAQEVKTEDVVGIGLAIGGCSSEMYEAILDRHHELKDVKIVDTIQLRPTRIYEKVGWTYKLYAGIWYSTSP